MAKIFLDFKYFCIKCPSKNYCLVNKLGILNKIFNPPKSIKPFLFKKAFYLWQVIENLKKQNVHQPHISLSEKKSKK